MIKNELIELIRDKRARVGVIGLGYVGLPLASEFAGAGIRATGFEVDEKKAGEINAGRSYIADVSLETINQVVDAARLSATTDFDLLRECDAIIICVPTPLRKTKEPDVSFILAAAEEIKKRLRRGQLIILESTTYPGTTDEVLMPILQETGLKLDDDFLLAFSPERVDPGNSEFKTHNIPKVVGGVTDDSTEAAPEDPRRDLPRVPGLPLGARCRRPGTTQPGDRDRHGAGRRTTGRRHAAHHHRRRGAFRPAALPRPDTGTGRRPPRGRPTVRPVPAIEAAPHADLIRSRRPG